MSKILVNGSNLHVGGGVQVGTSFIAELTRMPILPQELVVWASTEIDANLQNIGCNLSSLPAYEVVNSYGIKLLGSSLAKRMQDFKAVFTIFGPLYIWNLDGINITGFAQPWIVYPCTKINPSESLGKRLANRIKFKLQSIFFGRSNQLIVELDHVKEGLLNRGIGSQKTIHVVRNCVSSLYLDQNVWQEIAVYDDKADIKLGFVGRNYAHKNTGIFPALIDILLAKYGLKASIYVTFTKEEWSACSASFQSSVINVGPLSMAQCPTFYSRMDGVIFPSLLECFSATPLEAMAMKKPLFASDRPFNRDICLEHAHYFDPFSASSAAQVIAQAFKCGGHSPEALQSAREHAINFSSPRERAEKYLTLLQLAAK